jgi:hypothetical protein
VVSIGTGCKESEREGAEFEVRIVGVEVSAYENISVARAPSDRQRNRQRLEPHLTNFLRQGRF